ncbi:hypothetical protein KIP69_03705 [Geobacter sulfurreducens]|jgi:hypothetical protein|uniref:Uncharacterized protein n=1 Tax=Geobacter sulfurreducens (strain ATCC 51573 / DSM 12127 / PCA) TaxID=243231 RepID=Q74F97_GEOSL|nr:hypothetical protein [Geobacter sulfurreducens]AAR34042.1 hypothetical protein GSU0712 [Geobacter sulfurreducens PCA]AJY70459.1 hypothetical protein RW64_13185 [Geobacter sulfurreducens]QVW35968.1 hypothetical protein KIP69_03705 [Geobacter sulfurreducens]UAC04773.1 hypothetical protein KVP06_03565 [Geobacter sulfurreducens]UTG93404.1 hypothetical protein J8622_03480 [Geobacter sulfurreducens]
MRKGLSAIVVGIALLGLDPCLPSDGVRGESGGGIIVPGQRIERFSIGDPAPDNRTLRTIRKSKGIGITTAGGIIGRITVSSPRYEVERNRLKAGATLAEVLRFYGRGEKTMKGSVIVLTYADQGVEFVIDPADERVRSITVFRPVVQKPSAEQYRKLYEHREKLKAK